MYTGLTGKVTVGEGEGQRVAYISNWSVEATTDVMEITQLGCKTKEKLAGLQSWSASADGAVDFTDGGQKALFNAKKNGEPVSCKFYLKDNVFFAGKGIIESLSFDLSAEDKGNVSISVSGTGELTMPTDSAVGV